MAIPEKLDTGPRGRSRYIGYRNNDNAPSKWRGGGYAVVPLPEQQIVDQETAHKIFNVYKMLFGAANRTRTCDPVITNTG
jgi:hypothetical protein